MTTTACAACAHGHVCNVCGANLVRSEYSSHSDAPRWFHYKHLPEPLRSMSEQFHGLAAILADRFTSKTPGELFKEGITADDWQQLRDQTLFGFQKLVEAKDCFVRCERVLAGGEPKTRKTLD